MRDRYSYLERVFWTLLLSSGPIICVSDFFDKELSKRRADVTLNQSIGETNQRAKDIMVGRLGTGSKIYGYDTDKDGRLDKIIEYWTWYGSKAACPMETQFIRGEKNFDYLENLLETKGQRNK